MSHDDLKTSFEAIAQDYTAVRPSYPQAIVPLILNDLPPSLRPSILEIGCGSGQATHLFAALHIPIIATDISPSLLTAARQRLQSYPNVQFLLRAFEDLALPDASFTIILSAQAFHWIEPAVGIPKLYRLLHHDGIVALVWNFIHYDADPALSVLRDDILSLIPAFAGWPDATDQRFTTFAASWHTHFHLAPFVDIREQVFPSTFVITSGQLHQLLSTFSWFQTQSSTLQAQVQQVVDRYLAVQSPVVNLPIRTLLIRARKAAS